MTEPRELDVQFRNALMKKDWKVTTTRLIESEGNAMAQQMIGYIQGCMRFNIPNSK